MTLRVVNPATEETIAELEQAGVEEADEAVARAKAAIATLVEEHAEELAQR